MIWWFKKFVWGSSMKPLWSYFGDELVLGSHDFYGDHATSQTISSWVAFTLDCYSLLGGEWWRISNTYPRPQCCPIELSVVIDWKLFEVILRDHNRQKMLGNEKGFFEKIWSKEKWNDIWKRSKGPWNR